jgi:hypothetical protein
MEEQGEYLDIYQLKIDQGNQSLLFFQGKSRLTTVCHCNFGAPTMAEIRLRLTKAENAETGRLGTVSWIIQGINLEDAQYIRFF